MSVIRAAARLCALTGTDMLRELVESVRTAGGVRNAIVLTCARNSSGVPIGSPSDFASHPSVAPLIDVGVTHLRVFDLHSIADERTVLLCVVDSSVPLPPMSLDALDLLVTIASASMRASAELETERSRVAELQRALESRVVIEQAKGVLAQRLKTSPDEAFRHLRQSARASRVALSETARSVVDSAVVAPIPAGGSASDSVVGTLGRNTGAYVVPVRSGVVPPRSADGESFHARSLDESAEQS